MDEILNAMLLQSISNKSDANAFVSTVPKNYAYENPLSALILVRDTDFWYLTFLFEMFQQKTI